MGLWVRAAAWVRAELWYAVAPPPTPARRTYIVAAESRVLEVRR